MQIGREGCKNNEQEKVAKITSRKPSFCCSKNTKDFLESLQTLASIVAIIEIYHIYTFVNGSDL
jgi:hypothetical protein